ncbi:MAG: hypothetical protein JWN08_456 [Frankiales bacterium]|nr:hypothetical protein [Frankiales bacterium]
MPADPDAVMRGARGRVLPPQALAGLREAFAAEVADRLPRLQAVRPGASAEVLAQALRDAHSLGSSAVVLGEPAASRTARAVEAALTAGDVGPVPGQVRELTVLLAAWQA